MVFAYEVEAKFLNIIENMKFLNFSIFRTSSTEVQKKKSYLYI